MKKSFAYVMHFDTFFLFFQVSTFKLVRIFSFSLPLQPRLANCLLKIQTADRLVTIAISALTQLINQLVNQLQNSVRMNTGKIPNNVPTLVKKDNNYVRNSCNQLVAIIHMVLIMHMQESIICSKMDEKKSNSEKNVLSWILNLISVSDQFEF